MNETTIPKLVAALPLAALLGVALAVTHAFGMLAAYGRDWLAWLTLSDLVPLTFIMLPFTVLGLAVGALWHNTENDQQKVSRQTKEAKFETSRWGVALNVFAFFCLTLPILVAVINFSFLMKAGRYLPIIAVAHLWSVARLPMSFTKSSKFFGVLVSGNLYGIFLIALFTGHLRAEAAKTTDVLAKLTTTEGLVLCQRIVYTGERGVILYNAVDLETTLVPRDQVKLLSMTKNCWRKPQV